MGEPAWAEIQRPAAIASFVLPLLVAVVRPGDQQTLTAETVMGTGFLVAEGRGLGITARHVVTELLASAPIPDPWTLVADVTEIRTPVVGFITAEGHLHSMPVGAVDLHPTEDIALFRLPDGDYGSPYTVSAVPHDSAAEYAVWGYPDEMRHDFFTEGNRPLNVPLVYSAGHIRRRVSSEIPITDIQGRYFYELSTPAGSCCSGAPVSLRGQHMWQAIGVYVGERRDEAGTFAVGYATRAAAIAEQWPLLVDPNADLSGLCPLPPGPPPEPHAPGCPS
jgi:hypothetical protein